ncbi:hypothetical protein GR160_18320 [Flavobacterium sp. Sd200]|uniref:hypothetical protein n=1 Tax=Flavobacterium sp. Sd200 TaxID=2692211 RepID=UPI00136A6539|nr:hypothetical protein [Flavobacterium sp. Sd200]MXN93188.1 hypothetical protein [Flavobacterium sp. Sd200]
MRTEAYIKFLLNSVNAHGVHSPFIYSLIANGFYKKQYVVFKSSPDAVKAGLSRQGLNILFRTISYFKSYKFLILGEDAPVITEAIRASAEEINSKVWFYSNYVPVPGGADLIYLTGKNEAQLMPLLERAITDINNNTVAIIGGIHETDEMEAAWQAIKKDPRVTVSIDTYHLGLVFFRREQANQHFIIRPYRSFLTDAVLGIRNLWGLLG